MNTQETKSVKTWGGFNVIIFKINLNPLSWNNRNSYNKTYKPSRLTSYCYSKTYWHDHVQTPRSRTPSFLNSPASRSTPACVSLSFNGNNWIDYQGVDNISSLKTLSLCKEKLFTDLIRYLHKQQYKQY